MVGVIYFRWRVPVLVIAIVATQILLVFSPKLAQAETASMTWSWATTQPTVFSSNPITDMATGLCPNNYEIKDIAGESDPKKVCISKGNSVSFGTYYTWPSYLPVVSFSSDTKMYRLNGICGQYDGCLYLPGDDSLVTKQYLINGIVRSLVIYKNFTNRLTRFFNLETRRTEYHFDSSNPDYIFQSDTGYAWPIGGVGASDNSKWLAVELRGRGIGLLDVETMQMKRISTTLVFRYGVGYDPVSELSVSNDGQHIALMGSNAGLTVFDVDSNCGDEATSARLTEEPPIVQPCRSAQLDTTEFINHFIQALHPKFNDEGTELNFYATSYTEGSREVSVHAASYASQRLDYLALGDSFSSGEGESDDSYYVNGTNNNYEKCHVSTRSYPFLIANLSGVDPNYTRSVACSGARMGDVLGGDKSYLGQGNRFNDKNMDLNHSDQVLFQTQAVESFLPGRVHQESFVKKYQPEVITIGIGGNDAGFMDKLRACLGPDSCVWAGTSQGREQTAVEIKNLYGQLVNAYQTIHAASPRSKIYAIGYPQIIDETGQCSPLINYLLDSSEKQFMNQAVTYLNQVMAAAAKTAGIKYVDIQNSYGNQVLCGSAQSSAMNSIKLGDDNSPIEQLDWLKVIGQESFHPNSLGYSLAAESIFGSVGNIMNYNYCSGGAVICPENTPVPEPSSYWLPETYHDYPLQEITDFVSDRADSTDNRQKQLILASQSLAPDSAVEIEINSTPQILGQFNTTTDGSLDVSVDLPIDLEEGYHTVHIYGTSYSGESVDLYQVIDYRKPIIIQNDQPPVVTNDGNDPVIAPVVSKVNDEAISANTENSKVDTSSNVEPNSENIDAEAPSVIEANIDMAIGSRQLADAVILPDEQSTKRLAIINQPLLKKETSKKQPDQTISQALIYASCAFIGIAAWLVVRRTKS